MNSNATYNIDIKKLVLQLLPQIYRQPKHVAWLQALVQPLITLYALFNAFRNSTLYQLSITPQVCYLEKMLNDKYDVALRRIYIDEPPEIEGVPLYQEVEVKPQVLFTEAEVVDDEFVLYQESESEIFSVDFIVVVPLALEPTIDLNELTAILDAYKLTTKTYKVQFV